MRCSVLLTLALLMFVTGCAPVTFVAPTPDVEFIARPVSSHRFWLERSGTLAARSCYTPVERPVCFQGSRNAFEYGVHRVLAGAATEATSAADAEFVGRVTVLAVREQLTAIYHVEIEWGFEMVDREGRPIITIHDVSSENQPAAYYSFNTAREGAYTRAQNAAVRRIEGAVLQSRLMEDDRAP